MKNEKNMCHKSNLKRNHFISVVRVFICLFLLLITLACVSGGENSSAKSCVSVTVDKIKDGSSIVDVLGTVTNNCDSDISYVRVETTCFSSSGSVLDRDPEYVENIAGGKHAYYDAVIDASPDQVKNCVSEVMEAEYE